jgi:tripartite-type tricarboxylate transporter receptor subunit TctC
MSAELFKLHHHRGMGGGAYTDMLSGRVQVAFDDLPGSVGYIRAGQFRALGVTTAARSEVLPDVPSISEFLPSYDVSAFYGLNVKLQTRLWKSSRKLEEGGQL